MGNLASLDTLLEHLFTATFECAVARDYLIEYATESPDVSLGVIWLAHENLWADIG